jgi:hypothetical protein
MSRVTRVVNGKTQTFMRKNPFYGKAPTTDLRKVSMPPPPALALKNTAPAPVRKSAPAVVLRKPQSVAAPAPTAVRKPSGGLKINKRLMRARKTRATDGAISKIASDPLTMMSLDAHPALMGAAAAGALAAASVGRGHARATPLSTCIEKARAATRTDRKSQK